MKIIDADALIAEIESAFKGMGYELSLSGALFAVTVLKCAPTLTLDDLRPKGRWVHKRSIYDPNIYICSNCKEQISILGNKLPSCPYCIADMRGGDK